MNTPPVPDGPDTELAAAVAWFREDPKRLDFAPITEWSRHLRTIVRAYFARPAAGRDLVEYRAMMDFGPRWMTVTKDEAAAELRRGRRVLSRSVSPWRAAQHDDVRPADEPRRCPMDGEPLIAMTAHRDGVTFYRHADGHGHLDARAELSAAPADDTAGQDESAPGISAWQGQLLDARAAVSYAIEESISEFVSQRVDERGGGFEADPSEAARIAVDALVMAGWRPAPADDTAAPDGPPTTITVTLPAAEHDIDGEDDHGRWTQNPAWETSGIDRGVMSAWAQGVCIEDVLHDEGDVIELEETSRKVLAAIEWHRHYARLLAAETAGQPVRGSQNGGE